MNEKIFLYFWPQLLKRTYTLKFGEMAEWLKAHAWKVCIPQKGIAGSNPALSAMNFNTFADVK